MNAVNKIEQHNPIGTDGFEFVEFTAPNAEGIEQLRTLFTQMGFTETAKHRSKEVWLFQQHDINIVLNGSPTGHVREFGEKHGPSACAMASAADMSQPMTAPPPMPAAMRSWPVSRCARSQTCQPSGVSGRLTRAGQSGHGPSQAWQ